MHPDSQTPLQDEAPNTEARAQLKLLSRGQRNILLLVFSLGLVGTIAAIIAAIIRWNFAFSHYGPAVVWYWTTPAIIIGLVLLFITIAAMMAWSVQRNHIAFANSAGITLQLGRRRQHFPWESLCDLKLSVVRYGLSWGQWGIRTSALVITESGKRLRFRGSIEELEPFTNTIKSYLYPIRLREYRRALQSQKVIVFGPLRCSPDGLTYRRQHYPWDTVASARLEAGRITLTINQEGKPKVIHIDAGRIPNPDLCAQLLENIQ